MIVYNQKHNSITHDWVLKDQDKLTELILIVYNSRGRKVGEGGCVCVHEREREREREREGGVGAPIIIIGKLKEFLAKFRT